MQYTVSSMLAFQSEHNHGKEVEIPEESYPVAFLLIFISIAVAQTARAVVENVMLS